VKRYTPYNVDIYNIGILLHIIQFQNCPDVKLYQDDNKFKEFIKKYDKIINA